MFKSFKLKLIPILALGFFVFAPVTLADSSKINSDSDGWKSYYRAKILSMVNVERKNKEMGSLEEDELLQKAAQMKAEDMAKRGYFSHDTPEGKEPWYWLELNDIKYGAAGENLAAKFKDPSGIVPAWMNSPSHKKNVLNSKYTKTGIGIAKGEYQGKETIFVVELYVKPAKQNLSSNFFQKYF